MRRVAVEAMVNGIPAFASDRGTLPETLGAAGLLPPSPEPLILAARTPPTAEEVAPWVEAGIRLRDDHAFADEHRRRAIAGARRRDPEVLEPQYAQSFEEVVRRREAGESAGRSSRIAFRPIWCDCRRPVPR